MDSGEQVIRVNELADAICLRCSKFEDGNFEENGKIYDQIVRTLSEALEDAFLRGRESNR